LFFNPKRYDQAKVGRHKVSKKLAKEYPVLKLERFGLEVPNARVEGRSGDFTLTKADILATVSYIVKLHNRDAGYFPDDIDRFGFIETPYRKVEMGRVTDEIAYLAADDEDEYVIAQANARVDEQGRFLDERVLVRAGRGEIGYVAPEDVQYMDVSPKQLVSVATALI